MAASGGRFVALRLTVLATLLFLVVQYLLGLWTSAYAPAQFTTSASSPSLGFHYLVGYLLFVLGLLVVAFSFETREPRFIAPAVGLLVAIALAGAFGRLFVSSTPNNPIYSIGMGVMFLLAFGAAMSIAFSLRYRTASRPPIPPEGGAPSPTT